jgi:hypothetical protein
MSSHGNPCANEPKGLPRGREAIVTLRIPSITASKTEPEGRRFGQSAGRE